MLQISSLFYSEFPLKLYHYAHYYAQNLLIIFNFTREFLLFFSLLQSKTSKMFYSLCVLLSETVKNSCYCSQVLSN